MCSPAGADIGRTMITWIAHLMDGLLMFDENFFCTYSVHASSGLSNVMEI
jgi:hypothetical protein